jgi:hypothetical protein
LHAGSNLLVLALKIVHLTNRSFVTTDGSKKMSSPPKTKPAKAISANSGRALTVVGGVDKYSTN